MRRDLLRNTLQRVHPRRLLVLGDLMLDRYTWGDAKRVSPEAPVLVLTAESQEWRLGGAASVAVQLRGWDCEVLLGGILGEDGAGRAARRLLGEAGVGEHLLLVDQDRPTTLKERFMGRAAGRHAQQILRVDSESRTALSPKHEEQLLESIDRYWHQLEAVIISDYGKGVCTDRVLSHVLRRCRESRLPVIVDPTYCDYRRYGGATVIAPNRAEAAAATGRAIDSIANALAVAQRIALEFGVEHAVVSMDRDGIVLASATGHVTHLPTESQEVYDVTGAGDTVAAALGIGLANGLEIESAARFANVAAGLQVQRLGASLVTRAEIEQALTPSPRPSHSQRGVVDRPQLMAIVDGYRRAGQTLALTNGCFDLLHVGHLRCLEDAASLADVLIVAINSDASVRRLKGPSRPIVGENERAALVAALACVDHVTIFEEDTPHALLQAVRPDLLVKGGTYAVEDVVGRELVESYGGSVCVTGAVAGVSTTQTLTTIERVGLAALIPSLKE